MLALFLTISGETDRLTVIKIYSKYSRSMYSLAMSILKNPHDAQDALMEAFKRIIKNIKKFNNIPCNKIEGLLVIYIRNASFDIYNANKKFEKHLSYESNKTSTVESAEDIVVSRSEAERLVNAITKLPLPMSSALLLRYEYGYSFHAISIALNITESSARSRISRAKAELRKIMYEEGSD